MQKRVPQIHVDEAWMDRLGNRIDGRDFPTVVDGSEQLADVRFDGWNRIGFLRCG